MGISHMSATKRRRKKHQPWFDTECKEARRALQGVVPQQAQISQLRALFQRKARAFASQRLSEFNTHCRKDPAYIWRALQQGVARSAPVVPYVEELSTHFYEVFAGVGTAPTPPLAPPT